MTDPVQLYGFFLSPHVRAAHIAFAEKSVPVALQEAGLDRLPNEAFGRINPFQKMPALTHGAVTLFETPALLVYADAIGTGPALEPTDAFARARMWQCIGVAQSQLYPIGVMRLFLHSGLGAKLGMALDPELVTGSVAPVTLQLDVLAGWLDGGALAGGQFSLADIYCGTMVDMIDRCPAGHALVAARPALAGWLEALRGRASFRATLSPMLAGMAQA